MMLHCTESAIAPASRGQWAAVFRKLGLPVTIAETGCCGMAGLFGHEARNAAVSDRLFRMSWEPHVAGEARVLATGFSCRCQVERKSQAAALHPMALVAERCGGAAAGPAGGIPARRSTPAVGTA